MSDYVMRGTGNNGTIRVFAVDTTETLKEAQRIHDLYPVPAAALGRTFSAAAMMSLTGKSENRVLTIQIKGDGKLGGIIVVADADSNLKGYVGNPHLVLPLNKRGKLDVATAVGKGYLNIIMDLGLKEPYIGFVDLVSGEIAGDIASYYAHSEQIPTVIALGVLVEKEFGVLHSGGYLIQLMPGSGNDLIDLIEERIAHAPCPTDMFKGGKSPEEVLMEILGDMELKFSERKAIGFKCDCSRERMFRGILTLGKDEIRNLVNEGKIIETHCHFCNRKYNFSPDEFREFT